MKVTREQILETARKHFARAGYRQTSLAAIAEELGVVKGALYYHVPGGKKEMFDAVVSQEEAFIIEQMTAAAHGEADACRALRAAIRAKIAVLRRRRQEMGVSEDVLEEIKMIVSSEVRPFHGQELTLFEQVLAKGVEQGCVRVLPDPRVASTAIQALVRHVEMQEAYQREGSPQLEALLDLLEFGLARREE
ncbi:MAG: TetR family transcriptional regulator [Acidobacteriota bacterium]|nr:TetR family transcriptional regulator [Acidobacteriota bacterium]MDQ7087230.1 TetR family transcriptional regulator [Acidobacteriota bacterium]